MRLNMALLMLLCNSEFRARPPESHRTPSRGLEWVRKFAGKGFRFTINYL